MAAVTGLGEPISPELVLVCPELRAGALGALPMPDEERLDEAPTPQLEPLTAFSEIAPAPRRMSLLSNLLAYVAWQTLVGVLLGVAVVATVAAVVAVVAFVGR
jgi:hypothetical protein